MPETFDQNGSITKHEEVPGDAVLALAAAASASVAATAGGNSSTALSIHDRDPDRIEEDQQDEGRDSVSRRRDYQSTGNSSHLRHGDSYNPKNRSRSPSPRSPRSRSRSPTGAGHYSRHRRMSTSPERSNNRSRNSGSDRAFASQIKSSEAAKRSKKECRVYVGNLAYSVRWNDLKDFMKAAGDVVFAEVLTLPNGMSKGCGIVEYERPEDAQRAIRELSDTPLNDRNVFVREDREDEARYGTAPPPGRGAPAAGYGGRGGYAGGRGGYAGSSYGGRGAPAPGMGAYAHAQGGSQLYVGNLPFSVGWQDLKDLFRSAGNVIRADVQTGADGRPKGSGIVVFSNAADAANAINMYNGWDFQGRPLEVREDRFAGMGPPHGVGSFGGGGGYGAGAGAGSYRGGYGGGAGRGGSSYASSAPRYSGGFANVPTGPAGGASGGAPSQQIYVKNLPWSTSNEDLVELFQTTGKVDEAEILYENGRSRGVGVVQFATVEEAETAIAKFSGYVYGGRALDLEFHRTWRDFAALRANGGDPMHM